MTKQRFAEILRANGYQAENVDGCVMAFVPEITKKVQRDVTHLAETTGYRGSYGWKVVKKE